MLSISGKPYDTLEQVIGISGDSDQSLKVYDIQYKDVDLNDDGTFKTGEILKAINEKTKMVYIQRSAGYSWRPAIRIEDIENIIKEVKSVNPDVVVMVDNCYGEFLDYKEPTDVGADIMAGSLIKNPGGGLALTGGYVVGRTNLVEKVAARLTSPGIGKECGLTFGQTRSMFQGLFMAPNVVAGAIKGLYLHPSYTNHLIVKFAQNPMLTGATSFRPLNSAHLKKWLNFVKAYKPLHQ